ncbi:LacI family DNA-binding transcriptional regulator [Salinisphaera aquimarina]|uniref:LacI family DNA-binding transcriptional regulator n=1 Tax=Salinisphaera aquimarina TaxID=2094031 RepID=A0ABV7EV08_9GAMM
MAKKKQITIDDVAARAGVSTATVSRVLNGMNHKASLDTRTRIRSAVEELEYRPVRVGRALSMMQSPTVALLTPDTTNAFYASIADAIQTGTRRIGKAMILCNTREQAILQDAYIEEMRSHLVAGIALLGAVPSPGLERALADDMPIVFINRKSPYRADRPFVGIDNYAAGGDVAKHFMDRGYYPISVVRGPWDSSASRERFEGFRDALAASGHPIDPARVYDSDLSMESGYIQAEQLLSGPAPARAVFCANDPVAYGIYRRCGERGLSVPDDVALFGFDDNPLNEWLAPWLSTVSVPSVEIGTRVAKLFAGSGMASAREHPEQCIVPYQMVIRTSA